MQELQDQPIDLTSDVKRNPVAVPKYHINVPTESPRADLGYMIPNASGASLDNRADSLSPVYSEDPRVGGSWQAYPNPFSMMLQKTGSKRKSDGGLNDWWPNKSASPVPSRFGYMENPTINGFGPQLHSAITANHSGESLQRMNPLFNPLPFAGYAADPFKALPMPLSNDISKIDPKFSKQRPFKAVKPEVLNTDFSKQVTEKRRMLDSMRSLLEVGLPQSSPLSNAGVRIYAPQQVDSNPMESMDQLNTSGHARNGENSTSNGVNASLNEENCSGRSSSPKGENSGLNPEISNGSMGNTSPGVESVRADRSDSGVVGSTQPDEDAQNQDIIRTTPPRRKGKPIDATQKTELYWQKRNKNNVAAKKSRDARKKREDQLALKVQELYVTNQALATQIHDYERLLLAAKGKYEQEHEKYKAEVERLNHMVRFIEETMKVYANCTNCRLAYSKVWSR